MIEAKQTLKDALDEALVNWEFAGKVTNAIDALIVQRLDEREKAAQLLLDFRGVDE